MKSKILFLIWPFLSFIEAFAYGFSKKSHKLLLTLFSGFIGLNFAVDSESPDINTYINRFQLYYNRDFSYLQEFVISYFQLEAKHYDILTQVIYYVLSRFTDSPYILFLTFGLIFGYFYGNVFIQIGAYVNKKLSLTDHVLILVLLLLIFPTKGINQFRFYTASLIFINGLLSYFNNNKKASIYLMVLSLVTHIALILPIISFLISLMFKKMNIKVFITALIIIVLTSTQLTFIEQYINILGGSIEEKYNDYTGDIAKTRMESFKDRVWYAAYYRELLVVALLAVFLYIFKRKDILTSKDKKLLVPISFLALFTALTFNMYMYHRYFDLLAFVLLFYIIMIKIKYNDRMLNFYTAIALPPFSLAAVLNLSDVLRFVNPFIIVDNYFTVWFFQGLGSINSFL